MRTGSVVYSVVFSSSGGGTTVKYSNYLIATLQSTSGSFPSNAVITGTTLAFSNLSINNALSGHDCYFNLVTTDEEDTIADGEWTELSGGSFTYNFERTYSRFTGNGHVHFYISGASTNTNCFYLDGSNTGTITVWYQYDETAYVSPSNVAISGTAIMDGSTSLTFSVSGSSVSDCSHIITYYVNASAKLSITLARGTTNGTVTLPVSWNQYVPNGTYITLNVSCVTRYTTGGRNYDYGPTTAYAYAYVPESGVPTIGSFTITVNNARLSKCIHGISTLTLACASVAGFQGSTIKDYSFAGTGFSSSGSQASANVSNLPAGQGASYSVSYTVTITDSRGRKATATASVTIWNYAKPVITLARALRTDAQKVPLDSGTYITASAKITPTSLDGANTASMTILYKKNTDSTYTTGQENAQSETEYVFGSGLILPDTDYTVKFVATDAVGLTSEREVGLGQIDATLTLKLGGQGLAVGKKTFAENMPSFEVNGEWALRWGNCRIPGVIVANNEPQDKAKGMIWLKPIT